MSDITFTPSDRKLALPITSLPESATNMLIKAPPYPEVVILIFVGVKPLGHVAASFGATSSITNSSPEAVNLSAESQELPFHEVKPSCDPLSWLYGTHRGAADAEEDDELELVDIDDELLELDDKLELLLLELKQLAVPL